MQFSAKPIALRYRTRIERHSAPLLRSLLRLARPCHVRKPRARAYAISCEYVCDLLDEFAVSLGLAIPTSTLVPKRWEFDAYFALGSEERTRGRCSVDEVRRDAASELLALECD